MVRRSNIQPDVGFVPAKFIFRDHAASSGGLLPDFEMGAHACWYYARCAHKNLSTVDEGAWYEGERDHVDSLNNLAVAIARQYQLDSPEDFLKFMLVVQMEAARCDKPWDNRIIEPWKHAFVKMGN